MRRPVRAAVLSVALAGVVAGCAAGESDSLGSAPPPAVLPEGDPGTAAPEVPEPEPDAQAHEDEHDAPARTSIPTEALLDPATLEQVVGGSWSAQPLAPGDAQACGGALAGAGAARSVRLADDAGRVVVETVLSYEHEAGNTAVEALDGALATCGWHAQQAPPLGEQSVQARRDAATLLAVSAEGAVVVLTGHGGIAGDPALWESLADVALGTACPAAPGGCH